MESQYRIPAVGCIVNNLEDLARAKALEEGMPLLRLAYTPTPVGGKTAQELRAYMDGSDPVTKQPLMKEIVEYLTKPLTDEEKKTGSIERLRQRLIGPETAENLQRLFDENFWSDQLPFILPTEEKVAAMLQQTSHKPNEVIGKMSVTGERESWSYTVETVATNAVMAGLRPEYFQAFLALAATQTNSRPSSTASKGAMAMLNGPIVDEINLNFGYGALAYNYNNAGALIGRAWGLLSGNVTGGSDPGHNYLGNQGNPIVDHPIVFAENEAALPLGWKPLSVQKGFRPEDSVVSTFSGCEGQNTMMNLKDEDWEWVLKRFIGGLGIPNRTGKLLLIDPNALPGFLRFGFTTKEKLSDWVKKNITTPKVHYWLDQEVINYKLGLALTGQEPYATWLKLPDNAPIPYLTTVDVVVVGGAGNVRWSVNECGYTKSVKVSDWK